MRGDCSESNSSAFRSPNFQPTSPNSSQIREKGLIITHSTGWDGRDAHILQAPRGIREGDAKGRAGAQVGIENRCWF
jgi:hypothetical protein